MTDYEKLIETLKAELSPATEKLEDFFTLMATQYDDMVAELEAAIDEEVEAKAAETVKEEQPETARTAIDIDALFHVNPDFGYGKEPSLFDLVHNYYAPHFGSRIVAAYVDEYKAAIDKWIDSKL